MTGWTPWEERAPLLIREWSFEGTSEEYTVRRFTRNAVHLPLSTSVKPHFRDQLNETVSHPCISNSDDGAIRTDGPL